MAIPENIQAVLFDMDGTLVDTEPLGVETMRVVLRNYAIEITEEEWIMFDKVWRRDGTDISVEEFIHQTLQKHNAEVEEEAFIKDFYARYQQAILRAPVLPGAQQLLEYLKGKRKLAVVTASTQAQAQAVVSRNRWNDIFDAVISQDEYLTKKPDPASFIMAAERIGVSPINCVVVEDSKNGARAGVNAGMYVFGVRAGNTRPQDLSAANEVVDTLGELVGKF